MIKRILLGLLICFLASCDNDSGTKVETFSFENKEYEQLINDLNDLQIAISLKQVLNNNPERLRDGIDSALSKARGGLLLLAKTGTKTDEDKRKSYQQFVDALRQYDAFGILEFEQDRFDRVFDQVRFLKFQLAQELLLKTSEETWTILHHNFSTAGLEPNFSTLGFDRKGEPNDEAKWFTNFQIDLPKARVQGRAGANGWLISRPFDLRAIDYPSFRFFGSYLVVAPNNVEPLAQVIENVFKTYILIDYKAGDNPDTYPDSRKILVDYDLDDLPLGRDFHDEWVPFKSLEEHKHKGEISVAFLFDTRGINYTQYYSWTMFDFEINGMGKLTEDLVKYKQEFEGGTLEKFKSYSLEFPGKNWKVQNGRASLKSEADKIDTFLLSPKLDIPKEMLSPNLVIKESFFKETFDPEKLDSLEILISKNYKGGQSPLIDAEWKKIDHNFKVVEASEDEDTESKILEHQVLFPLNDYSGEEIVVAFRFKSEGGESLTWGIESLQVQGQGGEVTEIDYNIDNPSKAFSLASYVMKNHSVRNFKVESEENAPKWQKKTDNFVISGFGGSGNPAKTGVVRLILPEIDLADKIDARLRMKHKVFFFRDPVVSPQVTKIQIKIADSDRRCFVTETDETIDCEFPEWQDLEVPKGTFRDKMPREPELSQWIKIPDEYLGRKIQIAFKYQAQNANGGTVEWTLNSVEVGAK